MRVKYQLATKLKILIKKEQQHKGLCFLPYLPNSSQWLFIQYIVLFPVTLSVIHTSRLTQLPWVQTPHLNHSSMFYSLPTKFEVCLQSLALGRSDELRGTEKDTGINKLSISYLGILNISTNWQQGKPGLLCPYEGTAETGHLVTLPCCNNQYKYILSNKLSIL